MRLSLSFFAFSTVLGFAVAVPALGKASTMPADDGAYKTVNVLSQEECSALCQADQPTCRGSLTTQTTINDVVQPVMECSLNNGKGAAAMFAPQPPEPLDLEIALADFNAYRAQHGRPPVALNSKLNEASRVHATDLSRADIISHTGTDGSSYGDRIQRQGYYFTLAAENVATGQKNWATAFKGWQNSPGHNKNLLLHEVTDFGIAMVYDLDTTNRTYWSMLVATPMNEEMQDIMRYQTGVN